MSLNRRGFLSGGVAAAVGVGHAARARAQSDSEPSCLDYGLSFICNTASFNAVRFWLESRTTIFNDAEGTVAEFYQCASCKSEHTFADENLFIEDNYDFLPIVGQGRWLVFRRHARVTEGYRDIRPVEDYWGPPVFKLRAAKSVLVLDSFEAIRDNTAAGLPVVAQTEISNDETGLRAVMEFPVKTLNVSLDDGVYQVDTGPVAFPDLSKPFDPLIDCLSLAFVAFNAPHFADFVVEQATPVVPEGEEPDDTAEYPRIFHYSNPFSLPAKNRLLAETLPE